MVIAISMYYCIPNLHELWKGKYVAVHRIASNYEVMSAIVLHALSGRDITSSLFGNSKKIFYDR